jgi:hypothetical protein
MEAIKIVGLCIVAGAIYGVLHDQVTAHVCLEYFTVFHPTIFHTQSPTLLALGWGVLATWWVSLFLSLSSNPNIVHRQDGLADNDKLRVAAPGFAITRNPGVAMIWIT